MFCSGFRAGHVVADNVPDHNREIAPSSTIVSVANATAAALTYSRKEQDRWLWLKDSAYPPPGGE